MKNLSTLGFQYLFIYLPFVSYNFCLINYNRVPCKSFFFFFFFSFFKKSVTSQEAHKYLVKNWICEILA